MPATAEAFAIALQHHQAGRLHEAENIYREILAADGGRAEAWHLLGVVAFQTGRFGEAVQILCRAIELNGSEAEFHSHLGLAFKAAGKLDEAVGSLRRAVELKPGQATTHYNLGLALHAQGDWESAVASYRRAVELNPDDAEALNDLGAALQGQGKLPEAVECHRRALELRPDYAAAHNNLGNALLAAGKAPEAMACFRGALERSPDFAEAHLNLGNALLEEGKVGDAVGCYQAALALTPQSAEGHYNLGNALKAQGKLSDAIRSYRRAVELKPNDALAENNLGIALEEQRRVDEAIACFRRALEIQPANAQAHSNALLAQQYLPGVTLPGLLAAHDEFEKQQAAGLRATWRAHENLRQRDRPLRLGFVSPDFGRHPVGFFVIGAVENLDRQQFQTVCYSDRLREDDLTQRFRSAAALWRDVSRLRNEELAERIRADRIDILFDLAGHTANNRMLVFGRKPAPIQVSWAGYAGTTGLAAIDYLLADRYEVPFGADDGYRERVLRMPDGYVCYQPPMEAPAVSALPAFQNGLVTFGSFNRPAKIGPHVVKLWARILRRVPESRLVLKNRFLDDESNVTDLKAEFASEGIDPGRVECLGRSPPAELLAEYGRIDVALDPFPYNGGLTTCEALWMGVPVVTCPDETFASRHSLSHLSNVGLTETIGRNLNDYEELAVSLANDLPQLAELRSGLRERMKASPLCNGKRFAENLMRVLREIWRQWCGDAAEQGSPTIASKRHEAAFHNNRGIPLAGQRKLDEAIACFRHALELNPDYAEAHNNLGAALNEQGKTSAAAACFERALQLKPDYADAHCNLGNSLLARDALDDAVAAYHRALSLKPGFAKAHYNLGNALRHLRRFDEAFANYDRAVELNPDYANAHTGRAMLRLLLGDLERGWPEYEWRWKTRQAVRREYLQPRWGGGSLGGRTLLLHDEQGFGDTIQFVRYAGLVKEQNPEATVILECQRPLAKLLATFDEADQLIARGDELPAHDVQQALLSLPGIFRTSTETIPVRTPYLRADAELVRTWRERLAHLQGLRIGINWHGRSGVGDFVKRNVPLSCFARLAEMPGVHLINLQKAEERTELLAAVESGLRILDLGSELDTKNGSFMDTAAVMMNLDLVISSDTAIPHLAGALGVPVWLAVPFTPDWRWFLDRADSPWYPTMRIFRQQRPGDWTGVFQELAAAVLDFRATMADRK